MTLKASRDDRGYWHSNVTSTGQWQVADLDVDPSQRTSDMHSYSVKVEQGLPLDVEATATQISSILNDERGWTGYQDNSFQLVSDPGQADFTIYVGSADTVDELCRPDDTQGLVDCRNGNKVALNVDRWLFAAPPYAGQTIDSYRTYLVNHEVGHYIGFGHVGCPGPGQPAVQRQRHGQDGAQAVAQTASASPAAAGRGKSGGLPLARTGTSLTLGVLGAAAAAIGAYVLRLRRRQA